jgi:D-alanyl-D-alanine endopeptidase (penicillin-binding protein 7)
MHSLLRPAYGRLAQALAFFTLSCALSVQAAPSKQPAKKQVSAAASKSPAKAKAEPRKRVEVNAERKKAVVAKSTPKRGANSRKAVAAASAAGGAAAVVLARPSFGQMAGLHQVSDPLELKSSVALVMDQDTKEVLLSKNDHAVLPIASLTKLMTGLLISEAKLPMDEHITITQDDVDTEKHSSSRLRVGTTLTRGEMMHLALMSSENRAAHALGRTYPGGLNAFVGQMNAKAKLLGMTGTRYVEPTGLSSSNQSSAHDLAILVNVAHADPLLRELSTSPNFEVAVGNRMMQFNNTNGLVKSDNWDIGLQKTGYISEAGRCLVMQAHVAGRKLIMVFLDSAGRFSRLADAERVRHWMESKDASPRIASRIQ